MKPFALFLFFMLPIAANASDGSIKIGFVGDFSSVSRPFAENAFKIARYAVEEFNARGGVLGRPLRIIQRDGGNDPERHFRQVTNLVREENIVAVFGGASTHCVLQASAACKELKIPYLVSIGNGQPIVVENGHPYVFLFEPNSRMESLGFSIFASLMPWKRYAWFGPDYIWGRDVLKFFKEYFETIGSPITWTAEIWHPLGATTYEKQIQQVIASKPDALVVGTWGQDLQHFLKQARSYDLFEKTAAFGWFSIIDDDTERILPQGIWQISRSPIAYLSEKYPGTRAVIQDFFRQYHVYPLDFSICCYDSLIAFCTAAEKAGSSEPAAVAGALKGLTFTGLRGESFIRAVDGQMNCPTYFGRLTHSPDYPLAVIESVIEIPASKTWLPPKEVYLKRAEHRAGKSHN